MRSAAIPAAGAEDEAQSTWLPMIVIALGQVLMSFNVASLPVAIGGMVDSFGVPPTTIATGIVMYSLSVAGLVMLGAKLCQRFGAQPVFRGVVLIFGLAMVLIMVWKPRGIVSTREPSVALKKKNKIGSDMVAQGEGH